MRSGRQAFKQLLHMLACLMLVRPRPYSNACKAYARHKTFNVKNGNIVFSPFLFIAQLGQPKNKQRQQITRCFSDERSTTMNLSLPRDPVLLASRLLLAMLFVFMGWGKLTGFSGTVAYMATTGAPLPYLSSIIAILVELGFGLFIALGAMTSPVAILLALYTLATAFIGHHYWTFSGMERYDMWIHFYKNFSIAGGLLALAATGPGHFSIDGVLASTAQGTTAKKL
ncbi:DoxX family protein [Acetobacter persici]